MFEHCTSRHYGIYNTHVVVNIYAVNCECAWVESVTLFTNLYMSIEIL
jgi:hypothetical protein